MSISFTAPARWKTLESDDSKLETESAKRLTKASNTREGLYKMLWEPFEFGELTTLAKTDAKLKKQLFDELEKSGALQMPVLRPEGEPLHDRKLPR